MTHSWRPSVPRRRSAINSRMLLKSLLFFGFIYYASGLSTLQKLNDDVLNDAEHYRQLRLEHMRRHRRQQPKEVTIQVR